MAPFNIKIENIVASTALNVRIPLEKIVEHLEGTEYEPEQFPGLVYRMKDPKAAALIFSSGKIVCTGARSIADVKKVVKKVVRMIKDAKLGEPKKYKIQIENIVASETASGWVARTFVRVSLSVVQPTESRTNVRGTLQ